MNKQWQKLIFGLVVLLLTPPLSQADVAVGLKGGVGLTSAYADDWDDLIVGLDNGVGIRASAGLFLHLGFLQFLALQPELLYTVYTHRAEAGVDSYTESYKYLEIPVLVKLLLSAGPGKIALFAGPNLQVLLGDGRAVLEIMDIEVLDVDISSDLLNSFLYGLAFGASYDVPVGMSAFLTIDGRYVQMLKDAWKDFEQRSRGIFISIGVGFRF